MIVQRIFSKPLASPINQQSQARVSIDKKFMEKEAVSTKAEPVLSGDARAKQQAHAQDANRHMPKDQKSASWLYPSRCPEVAKIRPKLKKHKLNQSSLRLELVREKASGAMNSKVPRTWSQRPEQAHCKNQAAAQVATRPSLGSRFLASAVRSRNPPGWPIPQIQRWHLNVELNVCFST